MAYALGAGGQAGLQQALQILKKELDTSMAFCGYKNIEDVSKEMLIVRP